MRPRASVLGLVVAAVALLALDGARPGRGASPRGSGRPLGPRRADALDAEGQQAAPAVLRACEGEHGPFAGDRIPFAGFAQRLRAACDLAGGGPESMAALREALNDPWPPVRAAAALEVLESSLADKDDLACLEGLLRGDPDLSVRFAAALSLARLTPESREGRERAGPWWDGWPPALVQRAPRLREIVALLQQGPAPERADALRILVLVHAEQGVAMEPGTMLVQSVPGLDRLVVEVLTDLLDSDLLGFAIQVLGRCGPAAAEVVGRLDLSRGDDFDRHAAAVALLRHGARLDEALPILADELVEEDERNLFRWSPEPEEWRPLVPLLRASLAGAGPIPPSLAVRVAFRLGPEAKECVPDLLRLLDSPEDAGIALCALARIGKPAAAAVPRLVADIEAGRAYGVEPACVPEPDLALFAPFRYGPAPGPLACLDDVGGAPLFPECVEKRDAVLKAAALVAPRDPSVVRAALERLGDPSEDVRAAATTLLCAAVAAGDIAPDPVVALLDRDPSETVRGRAAAVLSFAARQRGVVVSRLSGTLERGDDLSKQYAARALRRAGAEGALVEALDSKSVSSRTWAAAALAGLDQMGCFFVEAELDPPCYAEDGWRSRAVGILDAALRGADPALRRLAVHVIGSRPELFPDCEHALATAERDPDEGVRKTAWVFSRKLEWRAERAPKEPPPECQPAVGRLLALMRGEGPWTPIDIALLAEGGAIDPDAATATLASMVADEELDPLERWCAAGALRRIAATPPPGRSGRRSPP